MSLLDFGMGTTLANVHMCGIIIIIFIRTQTGTTYLYLIEMNLYCC